ncbi:MAG: HlyD family type I secretion periplasmic adaptor subunit [Micropepsaceae bacterium]
MNEFAQASGRSGKRAYVETEFLPAALEILETPPRPLGRLVLWTIVVAAATAIAWSILSHVEIVAVAEGRIVPRERLQLVEAPDPGVVRRILVQEGEQVKAGQALVELDPAVAGAEAVATRTEYETALLTKARAAAMLAYIDRKDPASTSRLVAPDGVDEDAAAAAAEVVKARIQSYEARLAGLSERAAAAASTKRMVEAELAKLRGILPLIREQVVSRRGLVAKGLSPRLPLLQLEERLVEIQGQIEVRSADIERANAEISALSNEQIEVRETFRADAAAELSEAEGVLNTRVAAVARAKQREGFQLLAAPVDGTVHEIAVTTVGEVVEAGDPIVTVVPVGEDFIVEATVLNKDRGFVRSGDPVRLKVEAFPFTRYGYIEGTIEHLSPDAISDEKKGLVYPARIRPASTNLDLEGRTMPIAPGMSVQVEIVTGERRVIDYILSPIAKATHEAGRER